MRALRVLLAFTLGCNAPMPHPITAQGAPPDVGDTYEACGCGCCPAVGPVYACLYWTQGDSLQAVIAKDKAKKEGPFCKGPGKRPGCSLGTMYRYCD
ncbi:hypothetical protein [Myxococcus sp. AB036A]|uniref:hypothetical protein n=1 Tax=Myxococcus sp. AB036A TaxID=2562793 RepID=UPI001890FB70|nr:hypothetical protein [Myxococcus sp. AB036A]